MHVDDRLPVSPDIFWPTLASVIFAFAASLIAVPWFGGFSLSNSDESFAVAAVLAAALVGWGSWYLTERFVTDRPILNGTIAGVLTGIIAHPVAWFLWPIVTPSSGATYAFLMPFMSLWSLLFLGWLTAPVAGIAGAIAGAIRVGATRFYADDEP